MSDQVITVRCAIFFGSALRHESSMATTFLYRCPNTGQTVRGWSADEVTDDETKYQSVACLACAQVHLVNLKTGKVLGATED